MVIHKGQNRQVDSDCPSLLPQERSQARAWRKGTQAELRELP